MDSMLAPRVPAPKSWPRRRLLNSTEYCELKNEMPCTPIFWCFNSAAVDVTDDLRKPWPGFNA